MRPGRSLGVILNREEGELAVANPFDGSIIQVQMGDLESRRSRHARLTSNHRKAMVLSSDKDLIRADVPYRMVPPSVAIGKLGCRSAVGQPNQLVPQTDAKGRETGSGERANGFERIAYGPRIARAIGKEKPIGA